MGNKQVVGFAVRATCALYTWRSVPRRRVPLCRLFSSITTSLRSTNRWLGDE